MMSRDKDDSERYEIRQKYRDETGMECSQWVDGTAQSMLVINASYVEWLEDELLSKSER